MGLSKWHKLYRGKSDATVEYFKAHLISFLKTDNLKGEKNQPRFIIQEALGTIGKLSRVLDAFPCPAETYAKLKLLIEKPDGLRMHIQEKLDEILPILLNKEGTLNQPIIAAIGEDNYQAMQVNPIIDAIGKDKYEMALIDAIGKDKYEMALIDAIGKDKYEAIKREPITDPIELREFNKKKEEAMIKTAGGEQEYANIREKVMITAVGEESAYEAMKARNAQEVALQLVKATILSYGQRVLDNIPYPTIDLMRNEQAIIDALGKERYEKAIIDAIGEEIGEENYEQAIIDAIGKAEYEAIKKQPITDPIELEKFNKRKEEAIIQAIGAEKYGHLYQQIKEKVIMQAIRENTNIPNLNPEDKAAMEAFNELKRQAFSSVTPEIGLLANEATLKGLPKKAKKSEIDAPTLEKILIEFNALLKDKQAESLDLRLAKSKVDEALDWLHTDPDKSPLDQDLSNQPITQDKTFIKKALISYDTAVDAIIKTTNAASTLGQVISNQKPAEAHWFIRVLRFISGNEKLLQNEDEKRYGRQMEILHSVNQARSKLDAIIENTASPSLQAPADTHLDERERVDDPSRTTSHSL